MCLITHSHNLLCSVYTVTFVRVGSDPNKEARTVRWCCLYVRVCLLNPQHILLSLSRFQTAFLTFCTILLAHLHQRQRYSKNLRRSSSFSRYPLEKKWLRLSSNHSGHMSEDRRGVSWPKDERNSIRAFKPGPDQVWIEVHIWFWFRIWTCNVNQTQRQNCDVQPGVCSPIICLFDWLLVFHWYSTLVVTEKFTHKLKFTINSLSCYSKPIWLY